jgi:uroporphyrinogen decarboxylase
VPLIDEILKIGAGAYHFGNAIKMAEMLEKIPSDVLVCGNVDPVKQFINGTPESVRENTLDIMYECCPSHKNFVISSGCDITSLAKWENIDSFFSAVADYYSVIDADGDKAA